MRFFGCTSYDGSLYHGWQKQETTPETIQSYIDRCLSILLRAEIVTTGCGRTDTGVHAAGYYFHFDHHTTFDYNIIIYQINKILPSGIVIHHITPVEDKLHARFDAITRSYIYKIKLNKNPFLPFHTEWHFKLDEAGFTMLNELAGEIKLATNFNVYCKTGSDVSNCICLVHSSYWTWNKTTGELFFHITANRFLRGMIRLLVGMMINVVRGKLNIADAKASLHEQQALRMPWSAPADGLTLHSVDYGKTYLPPVSMV
ncbi:MAG: tRNA pseudouridine(38-40) synthase TruA [Saprospiraceae bacterium]|jgi:tRNA pseudouridine38-40 synthase|nr:tRNA pseudouridine(38-40) synthase TruA [Saprospiraceae bacterium]MBP9193233.1 tRNA pseudouridine(38-40) synthase TruA [Saprospiraceae bacterium]